MESLKRSIRYQLMESKSFILKFWITVLILNIFFYIISYKGGDAISIGLYVGGFAGPGSIVGANLLIILISLIPYSYERNYQSFPLGVSLGVTRKDYFISFLIDNAMIALIFATIQGILMKIDPFFVKLIGRIPLYDLLYFNTKTDNIFFIVLFLFVIFLSFISFWNLIASLNYKFGYKIWLIALGIAVVLSYSNIETIITIPKFIENLGSRFGPSEFITMFLGIAILYIINYLIVRKTNIKKSIG